MARPKAPTFDLQRAAILAAAAGLFARHGFHHASMAELAAACGVSKPLLYHYYRDKAHILFDIADSYMDKLSAIVAEVGRERLAPGPTCAHSSCASCRNTSIRRRSTWCWCRT
jgi:AcrR family transcriptional regulator